MIKKTKFIFLLLFISACQDNLGMEKCWGFEHNDSEECIEVHNIAEDLFDGCIEHHNELFCTFYKKDYICSEFGGSPCSCEIEGTGLMNECVSVYNFLGYKGISSCKHILESCM